jgi:type VI secretion system protein
MAHAVIDILTKQYADGKAVSMTANLHDALLKSVHSHLERLLNSRQGDLSHLPDYGLPDMGEIYQDLPGSAPVLTAAIKACIEKYEPRLKNVVVVPQINNSPKSVLDLLISGHIVGQQTVHYVSVFQGDGHAVIEMKRSS